RRSTLFPYTTLFRSIYDCTYTPERGQSPNIGRLYFTIDSYIDNFEVLEEHLLKENIYKGKLNEIYFATLRDHRYLEKNSLDLNRSESTRLNSSHVKI